jgi:MSHA biogenesis protein MshJ
VSRIKEILQPLSNRIDALTIRERTILAVTLLVALFFIWSALLMDEQIADIRNTDKEIDKLSADFAVAQAMQQALTAQLADDPNRAEQIRLERYQREAERIDNELRKQTLEFISPLQMIDVLKDLIQQEGGLQLVSLESIRPEDPLADAGEGVAETPVVAAKQSPADKPSGAYLHTLELKFKGDYLSAMRYIQRLESLQWRLIWKSLSIELEKYPVANVELQLQTLGLTEGWIGV